MPDFEVVWDGRGPLSSQDWPPQRWVPEYVLWPVEQPEGKGTWVRTCEGCGKRFRIPSKRGRAGQKYCGQRCYRMYGLRAAFNRSLK